MANINYGRITVTTAPVAEDPTAVREANSELGTLEQFLTAFRACPAQTKAGLFRDDKHYEKPILVDGAIEFNNSLKWRQPLPEIKAWSALFPALIFHVRWTGDASSGDAGQIVVAHGSVVFEVGGYIGTDNGYDAWGEPVAESDRGLRSLSLDVVVPEQEALAIAAIADICQEGCYVKERYAKDVH